MTEHILTPQKKKDLEQELLVLTTETRQKIAEDLEYAKSLGDLSENAEYHDARAYQAEIEARIRTIEHILKNATIVKPSKDGLVSVGSTVFLKKKGARNLTEYMIVGAEESDILSGRISYDSPIGSALIGKQKGDKVSITIPAGTIEYTIDSVK